MEHFATLAQAFDHQARKYGSRALLKQKRDKVWRDFSWSTISEAAGKLRAGLLKNGIKPGDRVAILSDNSPQWVIVDQAALGLGAVTTPLFTTSGAEEHRHVLNDSGARIIAANGDDMVQKVIALGGSIPGIEGIIALHPDATDQAASNGTPRVMTLDSASGDAPASVIEGKREDLATLIYTSGTTGPSKGVMLTHGNLLSNAEDAVSVLDVNESDNILSFLPVAHSFERTAGYYTVMLGGGEIAYAEGLTQIPANLQEIKPRLLLVVPRLLEAIYDRVQKTVRSSPPLRQRLFHLAIETGKRATEYRHSGKTDAAAAGDADGDLSQAGIPSHPQRFRRPAALPDFRKRAATDRDLPLPRRRRDSAHRGLRSDRSGAHRIGELATRSHQDWNRRATSSARRGKDRR